MFVRPRGATLLVALMLVTLAASAAPALASPVTATIRVEGLTGTVIPTTTVKTDARPITSDDNKVRALAVPSALTLLADVADAAKVPFACHWSDAYNDCFLNGFPAAFPVGATDFWRLVVNGKDAQVGFGGTKLQDGDRVDVIATDYTAPVEPPLLTLAPSVTTVPVGTSFTVHVTSLDTSGFGTTRPADQAVVSYGKLQAVANGDGNVSFMGTGIGFTSISATLPGATSSQVWSICAYGADPTVCKLDAPATPAPPAAAVATSRQPRRRSRPPRRLQPTGSRRPLTSPRRWPSRRSGRSSASSASPRRTAPTSRA